MMRSPLHNNHNSIPTRKPLQDRQYRWTNLLLLSLLVWGLLASHRPVHAQAGGRVQVITGTIQPGDFYAFSLPELRSGETLYVHMQATSGNLDPIIALSDGAIEIQSMEETYDSAVQQAIIEGRDPLLAAREAAAELFLVWDDDSGEGLAAAFEFEVPADGDYMLLVSNALTSLGGTTFGSYELLIGVDAPQVLNGEAEPSGDTIAILDQGASPPGLAVEELSGTLTAEKGSQILDLSEVNLDDTLYIYLEATSGELRPAVILRNYADKPVRTSNLSGQETSASLEYLIEDRGSGYALEITGSAAGTTGDYRLLVGVNAPDVLTGQGTSTDKILIKEPIPVQMGIKLQQIVEVDEQNEFFTVVASLQMEWDDPGIAFSPDSCNCVFKIYAEPDIDQFQIDTQGRWPAFTLYNQQGNRWTQNRLAIISQDGHATYFERFSTDLQVDFDFRRYPFDEQEFPIHIDALYPENIYYFTDLEGYTEISEGHGEDEFILEGFDTTVTSEQASTQQTTSRFTMRFGGPRHLNYYLLQIFVPLLLILAVSWVTFFLRDYGRRIEVASANLLVFIAFSFSLADNYPRLGYMTLLDAVMLMTFVISALVVIYNVWLRRMEMNDQAELADRIDSILDWVYPFSIIAAGVTLYFIFF